MLRLIQRINLINRLGWFYDVTGAYDSSFYAAGTVILVSGLICIPLPAISRWEKGRLEKKSIDAKV